MEENNENTFLSSMCDKNAEKEMDFKVTGEKINEIFKLYDIDLTDIDEKTKLPKVLAKILDKDEEVKTDFNNAILEMNKNKEISIFEVVLILAKDWLDDKELINKVLDLRSFHALRVEAKKLITKKRTNKLFNR